MEVHETFWQELPQIDIEEHQSFLSTSFAEKAASKSIKIIPEKEIDHRDIIRILNGDDQRAIGIMRKKMDNVSPKKVQDWMSKFPLKSFFKKMGNQLEFLVEMVKIAESDKKGRNYMPQLLDKQLDSSKLSSEEDRYLYQLHQIPNFSTYMQIVRMYQDLVIEKEEKYLDYLKNVVTACAEIRTSGSLKELMSCIVQVGKFLNSEKDFPGFDMSQTPLEYITNFKDKTEESTSIGLHSLNILEKVNPGRNYAKLLKSEMETVFDLGKPNALKANYVYNDLIKWGGQLKKIVDVIQKIQSNSEAAISIAVLNCATDVIFKKCSTIRMISEKVANVFFETMIYMGLNPVSYEKGQENPKLPSTSLYSPISIFIEHLLKDKELQIKELKKKAVSKGRLRIKSKHFSTKTIKKRRKTKDLTTKGSLQRTMSKSKQPGVLDEILTFKKEKLRHKDVREQNLGLDGESGEIAKQNEREKDIISNNPEHQSGSNDQNETLSANEEIKTDILVRPSTSRQSTILEAPGKRHRPKLRFKWFRNLVRSSSTQRK